MALDFPLATEDLVDLMMVGTATWRTLDNQQYSGFGSGEGLAADLGPTLWEADVSTVAADLDTIEALRARFNVLKGALNSFYLYNPTRAYPATDPAGAQLTGANVTVASINANRKELALTGLPGDFVLPMGTYASITAGEPSRTALLQFAADVTADFTGLTPQVEMAPHLRPWVLDGHSVRLIKPVAKVKLMPGTLAVSQVTAVTARLRFTARQTLAAG